MKILLVTGIYPPEIGGIATVAERAAAELLDAGFQISVIAYGAQDQTDIQNGVPVQRIGRNRFIVYRFMLYAWALSRSLKKGDTIIVLDAVSAGLPARLVCGIRGNSMVMRLGGERYWERAIEKGDVWCTLREFWRSPKYKWRIFFAKRYYSWLFSPVKNLVVVSSLLKEVYRPLLKNSTDITIIENRYSRQVDTKHPSDRGATSIFTGLFVGRLTRVKNVFLLKEVVVQLQKQGVSMRLMCVGDGDLKQDFQRACQEYPAIECIDSCSSEEVIRYMKKVDVLLLPSITDIYPNVVIEALSVGLPVIMTDEHGLEEGFGGILHCSPFRAQDWVAAIKYLMEKEAYQKLRQSITIPPLDNGGFNAFLRNLENTHRE